MRVFFAAITFFSFLTTFAGELKSSITSDTAEIVDFCPEGQQYYKFPAYNFYCVNRAVRSLNFSYEGISEGNIGSCASPSSKASDGMYSAQDVVDSCMEKNETKAFDFYLKRTAVSDLFQIDRPRSSSGAQCPTGHHYCHPYCCPN